MENKLVIRVILWTLAGLLGMVAFVVLMLFISFLIGLYKGLTS